MLARLAPFDFLCDCLQVHWVRDHVGVVPHFFCVDWFAEGPAVLVVYQKIYDFLALLLERPLICHGALEVAALCPACFYQARHLSKLVYLVAAKLEPWPPHKLHEARIYGHFDDGISLSAYVLIQ